MSEIPAGDEAAVLVQSQMAYSESHAREQKERALERARSLCERKAPYLLGGKSQDAFDCSGVTWFCYPMLPHGAVDQYEHLHEWMFEHKDTICAEPGDLIFFSELVEPDVVTHVGVISDVDLRSYSCSIIWASSVEGYVTDVEFELRQPTYGGSLLCVGFAKMQPFLARHNLQEALEDLMRG